MFGFVARLASTHFRTQGCPLPAVRTDRFSERQVRGCWHLVGGPGSLRLLVFPHVQRTGDRPCFSHGFCLADHECFELQGLGGQFLSPPPGSWREQMPSQDGVTDVSSVCSVSDESGRCCLLSIVPCHSRFPTLRASWSRRHLPTGLEAGPATVVSRAQARGLSASAPPPVSGRHGACMVPAHGDAQREGTLKKLAWESCPRRENPHAAVVDLDLPAQQETRLSCPPSPGRRRANTPRF